MSGEGQGGGNGERVTVRELYSLILDVRDRVASVDRAIAGLPCKTCGVRLDQLEHDIEKHSDAIEGLKREGRLVGAMNAAGALIAGALGIGK